MLVAMLKLYFLKDIIYLFSESWERAGEREGEKAGATVTA